MRIASVSTRFERASCDDQYPRKRVAVRRYCRRQKFQSLSHRRYPPASSAVLAVMGNSLFHPEVHGLYKTAVPARLPVCGRLCKALSPRCRGGLHRNPRPMQPPFSKFTLPGPFGLSDQPFSSRLPLRTNRHSILHFGCSQRKLDSISR